MEQQKGEVDYEAKDGTLGFAVGDTEKTLPLKLSDDDDQEFFEVFLCISFSCNT